MENLVDVVFAGDARGLVAGTLIAADVVLTGVVAWSKVRHRRRRPTSIRPVERLDEGSLSGTLTELPVPDLDPLGQPCLSEPQERPYARRFRTMQVGRENVVPAPRTAEHAQELPRVAP